MERQHTVGNCFFKLKLFKRRINRIFAIIEAFVQEALIGQVLSFTGEPVNESVFPRLVFHVVFNRDHALIVGALQSVNDELELRACLFAATLREVHK